MDPVNHPQHYTVASLEVIDIIERFNMNFHIGNVFKYIVRHQHKGKPIEDLKKALWYIERYKQIFEKKDESVDIRDIMKEFDLNSSKQNGLKENFLDHYNFKAAIINIIDRIFRMYNQQECWEYQAYSLEVPKPTIERIMKTSIAMKINYIIDHLQWEINRLVVEKEENANI